MKVPFLGAAILADITPHASKLLLYICGGGHIGRQGRIYEHAQELGWTPKQWRRAVQPLVELQLINYQVSTNGFAAKARWGAGRQFTWVPQDEYVWLSSSRACKVFLAICRALYNQTGTVMMGIRKMMERTDLSRRSVQLALKELRDTRLLESWPTGRSCVFRVEKRPSKYLSTGKFGGKKGGGNSLFGPSVAHRSRLLVRLLTSIPLTSITDALACAFQGKEKRHAAAPQVCAVRRAVAAQEAAANPSLRGRLEKYLLEVRRVAPAMVDDILTNYPLQNVQRAIRMINARPVYNFTKYLLTILGRIASYHHDKPAQPKNRPQPAH